ncbi:MAG: DEAD/DEAH box helicase [Planctomycetes bacterium]|nr:DEAD/DEAH box helicase [Planctomycetota bacterium]
MRRADDTDGATVGAPTAAIAWSDPLTALHGIGPKLAGRLAAALGGDRVGDLLRFFPRRHREIADLDAPAEAALGRLVRLRGAVERSHRRWLPGRRSLVEVELRTDDGTAFRAPFFNQPWLKDAWPPGSRRQLEGRLDRRGRQWVLSGARVLSARLTAEGSCVVAYPPVDGVSDERLRALLWQALTGLDRASVPAESLPPGLELPFAEPLAALRAMHRPRDADEHEVARRRFAMLEAVDVFRRVESLRRRRAAMPAPRVVLGRAHEELVARALPFAWTSDQRRAVDTIRALLAGDRGPMGVLLQGDVGTGKTAVALDAALAVIGAGMQVAFLAPTALLAEQHLATLRQWLAPTGVRVELLTGDVSPATRRSLEAEVADGRVPFVVGTHALLSERTQFAALGLAIVDEQHRFGVAQRMRLFAKGPHCHVLVTTATPIPRTLAWSLFGDLDAVVLRERPSGRPPPRAVFAARERWRRVRELIAAAVRRGGKVFVVCPRIGADGELGGAVRMHAELSSDHRATLVHGQLDPAERSARLAALRDGEVDVVVGTTVLEVGVDVPDATLMVVAGAESFGLATLHQLRGRVGRGAARGLCILAGERTARVAAVCASRDGFELAEADLRLRGAGELLGDRQSGSFDFRALDPLDDFEILSAAREAVRREEPPR